MQHRIAPVCECQNGLLNDVVDASRHLNTSMSMPRSTDLSTQPTPLHQFHQPPPAYIDKHLSRAWTILLNKGNRSRKVHLMQSRQMHHAKAFRKPSHAFIQCPNSIESLLMRPTKLRRFQSSIWFWSGAMWQPTSFKRLFVFAIIRICG